MVSCTCKPLLLDIFVGICMSKVEPLYKLGHVSILAPPKTRHFLLSKHHLLYSSRLANSHCEGSVHACAYTDGLAMSQS